MPSSGHFETQLRKREVDPGAVHRTSRLQLGQDLVFRLVLGRGRLIHLLDLIEGNAKQTIAVAKDQIAGLDHHAVERDRPADFAGTRLIWTAMGKAGRVYRRSQLPPRIRSAAS